MWVLHPFRYLTPQRLTLQLAQIRRLPILQARVLRQGQEVPIRVRHEDPACPDPPDALTPLPRVSQA